MAASCGASPDFLPVEIGFAKSAACADDVSFPDNTRSTGVVTDLPAGTYFVFVDSWANFAPDGGTGNFNLKVWERPIHLADAGCDPKRALSRCMTGLHCLPDQSYREYHCQ